MNDEELHKEIKDVFVLSLIIFIILVGIAVFSYTAFSWSPDVFCQDESNGSISEYLSCMSYFENLSKLNVTVINYSYVINNTVNNTEIFYINNSVGSGDFVSRGDVRDELSDYYRRTEIDERLFNQKQQYDLSLQNTELKLYSRFKDDLKNGGWLEQVVEYKPNVSFDGLATEEYVQDYVDKSLVSAENTRSVKGEDYTLYYFFGAIVLIGGGYFLFKKNNRAGNYVPPSNVQYGVPSAPSGVDETQRLLKLMNDQSHALDKLMKENATLRTEQDQIVKALKESMKE